jgi:hypothetical protein
LEKEKVKEVEKVKEDEMEMVYSAVLAVAP